MPDFFDRLIARARPPEASDVAFAYPRLPGPFERPAAPPPDPFIETIEEVREAPARMPDPRPAPSIPTPATRSNPPALKADSRTPQAPPVRDEPPPPRPAPAQPPTPTPVATPMLLEPETAPADQSPDRPSRPIADQERVTIVTRPEQAPPPAVPRPLAIPAAAVHPAQDRVNPPPPEPPVVTVRIGRIEVRDASRDSDRRERPKKNQAKRRPAPKLTLAAYLAAATGGSR